MRTISDIWDVAKSDGPLRLFSKGVRYTYNYSRWRVSKEYSLSLQDLNVKFSAPTYRAEKLNRSRFNSENTILVDVLNNLGRSDVFCDVGANTGLYTLFAAGACDQVISFEPYQPNVELLRKDISKNELSNVSLFDLALSDSAGAVPFDEPDKPDVG